MRVAALTLEVDAAKRTLLRTLFSAEVERLVALPDSKDAMKALSKWRKKVGSDADVVAPVGAWSPALVAGFDAWRTLRGTLAQALAAVDQALAEELPVARGRLREIVQRPLVRLAMYLLSPDMVDAMEGELAKKPSPTPDAGERALERRLYAFVQRLASKNETTSYFGPVTYGGVDASATGPLTVGPETPTGITRREVFCSFWAAAEIARAAAVDPALRPALAPRRIPVARITDGAAFGPDGKPAELDALAQRLFARIDGLKALPALAAAVEAPLADVERALIGLEKRGFARRDLEPSSTTAYPLRSVLAQLPQTPAAEPWRARIARFEDALARFGQAPDVAARRAASNDAEALFTEVTGKPARRGAGTMYADRTVLYEDCLGDQLPVVMAPSEATRLSAALDPVLELGAKNGMLRRQAVATLAATTLDAMGGGPVPFGKFAEAIDARVQAGELDVLLAPARALREKVAALATALSDGRIARVPAERLRELLPPGTVGRFASPDVMLLAEAGKPHRYVIGEVHPYAYAWGSQNQFATDMAGLQAAFKADLGPWGGPSRLAVVLRRRRHKGLVSEQFPGTFIEVTGRSVDDPARRVAFGDLVVGRDADGRPELRGPNGPLTLYVGEDDHPHLRAFAPSQCEMPPIRTGAHTPRIEVGDVVYQRERWDLDQDALAAVIHAEGPAALAREIALARARLGWPRYVFALSPAEPKPICLDLDVPFAQAHLQRLIGLGRLGLSEMLPGPGKLWLERSAGGHTSELRMALVRDPSP